MPDRPLLLRGARVLDARRHRLGDPADVLVRDGRIAAVGATTTQDARVIDLDGCTLVAGGIDLDVDLVPGPVDGDAGLWLLEAVGRMRTLLRRGVTTARVLGGADPRWSLVDLREAVAGGLVDGPALVVAPHAIDDTPASEDVALAVRREARNGADWIAVDRPGADADELRGIVAVAGAVPVAVSAQTTGDLDAAVAAGARSVQVGFPVDADRVRRARERGTWIVRRGEARATGSADAAACLGLEDRGAIEPGLRADIVAVAGDPLVDEHALDEPVLVLRAGVAV